jgi:hypothetical protein
MEFPPAWAVEGWGSFETAVPSVTGDLTAKLLAQVRHTGRVLDNFH